jgi:glycosyltransferase involved in cell wall biosynthesis
MSTLFFHRANDYTGSTRALANYLENEYSDNIVYVITTDIHGKGFLSDLSNVRIKKVCYPTYKQKRIKFFSYLVSTIHIFWLAFRLGYRFNTFYINTINPYQAAIVGRIFKKNITYHVHEKFIDKGFEQRFLEWIFNKAEAKRIFVSKYVLEQYPKKDNSIVQYNKLTNSFLSSVIKNPINKRERKNIIMISALSKAKGIFNFIKLANLLPRFNFTLILNRSEVDINSFINIDCPYNLKLIPVQTDIHPFLQKTDLLLNLSIPSLSIDTFGLTIIEAMAYGIPAIVPNIGGPTELIIDGYNGYTVDVTDINQVSHKVEKVLEKDTYTLMATNSLKRVSFFI